jgi:uncharacterized protein
MAADPGTPGNPELVTVTGVRRRSIGSGPVAFPDVEIRLESGAGDGLLSALTDRLIRVSVSERRGEAADQLDLVLDDADGLLAIPALGARLSVYLGWRGGGGTTPGLVPKGTFVVDEIGHEGPPDSLVIRGRSADFTGSLREARTQVWTGASLGQIVREIAARHSLAPVIGEPLASRQAEVTDQRRMTDLAFLRQLGRAHDAVATIKAGRLLFAPAGQGRTAGGAPIPQIGIDRSVGDRHSWRTEGRQQWSGVAARWHDRAAAITRTVTVGSASGPPGSVKQLRRRHASEAEARRAAEAEWSRVGRAPQTLTLSLALGRPELGPEVPVRVSGFKPQITETDWVVTEARHQLDGQGLTTGLTLEVRGVAAGS